MTVFIIRTFDSMASSMGQYEIDRVYLDETKALAYKQAEDDKIRSSHPNQKYPMLAQILRVEVSE